MVVGTLNISLDCRFVDVDLNNTEWSTTLTARLANGQISAALYRPNSL